MKTAIHGLLANHQWTMDAKACAKVYSELDEAYYEVYPFTDVYLRFHFTYVRDHIVGAKFILDYAPLEVPDLVLWGVNEREMTQVREEMLASVDEETGAGYKRSWARGYSVSEREAAACRPLLVLSKQDALFLDKGWTLTCEHENLVLFRSSSERSINEGKHAARFILKVEK